MASLRYLMLLSHQCSTAQVTVMSVDQANYFGSDPTSVLLIAMTFSTDIQYHWRVHSYDFGDPLSFLRAVSSLFYLSCQISQLQHHGLAHN